MSEAPSIKSASDEPPHKRLRKGTHSCIECRRRKKSCIPRLATPGSCEECYARGVQCRNQEVSLGTKSRSQGNKHDLQQRVTELETALLSISKKLDTTPRPVEADNNAAKELQLPHSVMLPSTPAASPDSDPEAILKHAPVLSLFDNAILTCQPDDGVRADLYGVDLPRSDAKKSKSKHDNLRRTLLSLFPSQQREDAILQSSHAWWKIWQDIWPNLFDFGPFSDTVQLFTDLKCSGNVPKIAKALLCLCVILQEGSYDLNTSYDTANAADRRTQTLRTIDEMVLNDDELAGTIDGVECILLRAKYDSNSGRIRKAWLTYRRGLSLAQLLGLNKRSINTVSSTGESLRKENLWKALYMSDRFLSLMLGLPYGPSEIHSDVGRNSDAWAKGNKAQDDSEHYLTRLAHIVGHIIDRNQQLPSNNMLPLTFKIEAEMTELAASMTSDWWGVGGGLDGTGKQIYSQLLPQFWHHQARTLLHLPFMLKATTDRRFEYSKIATVESAREMIARYLVIRPAQGFASLNCKMIDFMVFTAAMTLVLNLLDHYRKIENLDHSEADEDQRLISATTEFLQRASVETDGGVATQAARALEIFSNVKEMSLPIGKTERSCTTRVVIPYFGTVVIGPGMSLKDQSQIQKPESMPQLQQLPTPSDQSPSMLTPESAPPAEPLIEATVPFDFNYGEDSQGTGVGADLFADINLDLDQDWSWFWNNIDIPSMEQQGTHP